jgi:hypothetical protein
MMKRLKSFFGYGWALLCTLIVLVTFALSPYLSREFASATGITISPWHTGGAVERVIDHGVYKTRIHRPVFDGLLAERKKGFIQIDWEPRAGLPGIIEEGIDMNGDRATDFLIRLDTEKRTATITPLNAAALSVEHVYNLGDKGLAARVKIRRTTGAKP